MKFTDIKSPYLLFLGSAPDDLAAKTAIGIFEWRPNLCLGQLRQPQCVPNLPLPELTIKQAADRGAKTLVVGVVNRGGTIDQSWRDIFSQALRHKMDIASGLHARIDDIVELSELAGELGQKILDVRHPAGPFHIASALRRTGTRLLTVGTDCSVGKMYTSLALEEEMKARGFDVDFRATGQTGILIAGSGVAIDGVIADFIAGAAEQLSPDAANDHWDLVEGQGSLFHPSYAGVSLGLLHGTQPDFLVMCHEATRQHMRGLPHQPIPDLIDCISVNLKMARAVNPDAQMIGIAVNTKALSTSRAETTLQSLQQMTNLPVVDPGREGVAALVDCLEGSL